MKFKLLIIPLLVIVYSSLYSCKNNSEEALYGDCDTLNMTYSRVKYIFEDNCIICHYESYPDNNHGIILTSYSSVQAAINSGKLWPAINHTGDYKMPKNQTEKIDECQIAKIGAWKNSGMPY